MDIEHLSKSQIVLLTIMVTFVSSVTTGIVTITLMEQAPPAITQTVNRIVERTVERVVPQDAQAAAASAATNIITEKTVIVREADLIAKAVSSIEPSVVRLYSIERDEHGKEFDSFVGFGIVANPDGVIYADAATPGGRFAAVRSDGVRVSLTASAKKEGAVVIELHGPTSTPLEGVEEVKQIAWTPALFSTAKSSIGETVVALGGRSATRIASGIITAISDAKDNDAGVLETSIGVDSYSAGSPLFNTDGEIIGMATRASRDGIAGFLASSGILLYNKPSEEAPPQEPQS